MTTYDVLIAGGGPAGAAAAISARRAGLSVVVCDKARFPRDKTCGDGLTTNALRILEDLGLEISDLTEPGGQRDARERSAYQPVHETVLIAPSGRRVAFPLPSRDEPATGAYGAVVRRERLDAALLDRARAAGAEVHEESEVADVVATAGSVKAQLATGDTVEATHLIAADGHWSTVRRRMQPEAPRDLGEWHAARQYVQGVADRRLWVSFDRALLPGYAWVFPLPDGRANVGFGVLRNRSVHGRDLKALWPEVRSMPFMREVLGDAADAGPMRAWPIPARYERAALSDGPVLYAGDAARVVDSLTGEGIAQALETGRLAAEAIASGGEAAEVADRYRSAVHLHLGRDLRFARRLQSLLSTRVGAEGAIRLAGATTWTRRNFARWLFEDYPRALVLTPDRWRRGAFTGAGAYRDR